MLVDFRIIHWDYNNPGSGVFTADSNIQMLSGALKHPITKEKGGFYLRWALRSYVSKDLILSCIAETKHSDDVYNISVEEFIEQTEISLGAFKNELGKRMKETNITVAFDVDLTYQEAVSILQQLREQ